MPFRVITASGVGPFASSTIILRTLSVGPQRLQLQQHPQRPLELPVKFAIQRHQLRRTKWIQTLPPNLKPHRRTLLHSLNLLGHLFLQTASDERQEARGTLLCRVGVAFIGHHVCPPIERVLPEARERRFNRGLSLSRLQDGDSLCKVLRFTVIVSAFLDIIVRQRLQRIACIGRHLLHAGRDQRPLGQ